MVASLIDRKNQDTVCLSGLHDTLSWPPCCEGSSTYPAKTLEQLVPLVVGLADTVPSVTQFHKIISPF